MESDRVDPERLAAFLDGRLESPEREQLLDQLARSPEAYSVFANAAAVKAELQTGAGRPLDPALAGPDATRHPRSWRWRVPGPIRRRPAVGWTVVPALAAIILLLVVYAPRGGREPAGTALALLDGQVLVEQGGEGAIEAALGESWHDPGWPVLRGGGGLQESSVAFRLGTRLVQFEIAADARDSEASRVAGTDLVALLNETVAGPPLALRSERLVERTAATQDPAALEAERQALAAQIEELLDDHPWLELGIRAEQARLALAAGRASFFAPDQPFAAALDRLIERLETEDTVTGGEVASLLRPLRNALVRGASTGDLAEARGRIAELIRRAGA